MSVRASMFLVRSSWFSRAICLDSRSVLCAQQITKTNDFERRLSHRKLSSESEQSSLCDQTPFSGEIPIDQIEFKYCKSGGKGGQHVNKVATKVEVRFNLKNASWIPEWIKLRIGEKEANRITKNGEFIITSDKTRKQILNQADCLNRIRTIIYDASKLPTEKTPEEIVLSEKRKASRAAYVLKEKRHNSLKKSSRGSQGFDAL